MLRALGVVSGLALFALAFAAFGEAPANVARAMAGCWPGKAHTSGTSLNTIAVSGQGNRSYLLHVPGSYNGADPVALVFSFHGLGSNAAQQELYSGLSALSDTEGFIAVYPEGTVNIAGDQFWSFVPGVPPDDTLFTSELLDSLESQLCIDPNYVFSSGMSNGAIMSSHLACSLSSRIAAVAPVAGAYYPPLIASVPADTCPDTRAVPMIAFHGTADTTIPFNGGTGIGGVNFRLPIDNNTPDEDVMDDWQIHNGCTSGRTETTISSEVRRIEYDGCVDDATVELYAVDGGGHTWPGAIDVPPLGYTTHDISATQLMWQFFQAHPFAVTPSVDTDGDTIPNASDADNDNDGCSDAREAGTDPLQGGARNAKNFWDFGDMPDLSMVPMRDGKVRVNDIVLVVQHYFNDDAGGTAPINRNSDPLSVPPPTGYHPAYDRGAIIGPHTWDVAPPDGQIRINDILFVVSQYYNDCS